MSNLSNYDDVLNQLQAFGLDITSLDICGKMRRCRMVNGDREARGWFVLYEVPKTDGSGSFITGSFGVWHGSENNAQKVTLEKGVVLSQEQLDAIKARAAADKKLQEAEQRAKNAKAAARAAFDWKKLSPEGECDYLTRKQIGPNGGRFSPSGNFAIPVQDEKGAIHGLQIIYSAANKAKKGRDKEFYPVGVAKKGHFYQIGTPSWIVFIAEGFATAASIYEATGLPVVVAFDAGNLQPVALAIAKKYPKAKIVIACDDDYLKKCPVCKKYHLAEVKVCECGKEMPTGNPGVTLGKLAALAVVGSVVVPQFAEDRPTDKKGPTDFNDLAVLESPRVVEAQIAAHLTAMGLQSAAAQPRARPTEGGGDSQRLAIADTEEMYGRFALIYAANSVCFDHHHRILVKLSDVRDACADKNFVREWQANVNRRQMVLMDQVGFDPTETNSQIICNLWGGWPTTPKPGECSELLDLLWYLCSREPNQDEVYDWIIKWLAYPIQNPGAKMQSALVLHGPQGTGKNLFFDAIQAIYGEYGLTVDQAALEDNHNDWAGKKLFLIADEVVAQQEMHHIKNRLKNFVTCRTIRINPKHVTAHTESNHVNVVFLSNEAKPIVLERDDRRYCVVYAPKKMEAKYYASIAAEIEAGGVAALHDYLLKVDLSDFSPNSKPPMTLAKEDLIALSLEGWERFAMLWSGGDLNHMGILNEPCDVDTLYHAYRSWSEQDGQRYTPPKNIFSGNICKLDGFMKRERQHVHIGFNKRQVTMLYPPGKTDPPTGKTLSAWNTECIERVKSAIEHVKTGQQHEYA